jgi:hypothetical protein
VKERFLVVLLINSWLALGTAAAAADLKPETIAAFEQYVAQAEKRITQDHSSTESFLGIDSLPAARRSEMEDRLRTGEILIDKMGESPIKLPGALVHHWVGTGFIPGATLAQTLAVVRDYDHLWQHYPPEVVRSKLLSRQGNDLRISMRLRKHKVVTVVLDTEYAVHNGQLDDAHRYGISRSVRILELANPDQADEHPLPEGHDHGFLWRLNTYWSYVQASDGVFIQCESISLTRDAPTGVGWLIGPFIHGLPRESLQFTLTSTRTAVLNAQSPQPSRITTDETGRAQSASH